MKLAIVLVVVSILLLSTAVLVAADDLTLTHKGSFASSGGSASWEIDYGPNGEYMAIGEEQTLVIRNTSSHSVIDSTGLNWHSSMIRWGPNGEYVAVAAGTEQSDGTADDVQYVYSFDGNSLTQVAKWNVNQQTGIRQTSMAWSADGSELYRTNGTDLVRTERATWNDTVVYSDTEDLAGVDYSPDGQYIAVATYNNHLAIVDPDTYNTDQYISISISGERVNIDRQGDHVAVTNGSNVVVMQRSNWTQTASIDTSDNAFAHTFSESGDYLLVVGGPSNDNYEAEVYNESWQLVASDGGETVGSQSGAWSVNDSEIAVTTRDSSGSIQLYDTNITFSTPTSPTDTDEDLRVDVPKHLEHNESGYYEVEYNDDGTWVDVTNDSNTTITLSNPDAATFYPSNHTVVASGNTSINEAVDVQADYGTLTANSTLVVAGTTIENLDILPDPWIKTEASVGDGMMLWLIGAALVAIVGARAAGPTAGAGAYVMVMAAGWISTPVSDGVMIVSMTAAIFLGLNVALNVDTSVRGT